MARHRPREASAAAGSLVGLRRGEPFAGKCPTAGLPPHRTPGECLPRHSAARKAGSGGDVRSGWLPPLFGRGAGGGTDRRQSGVRGRPGGDPPRWLHESPRRYVLLAPVPESECGVALLRTRVATLRPQAPPPGTIHPEPPRGTTPFLQGVRRSVLLSRRTVIIIVDPGGRRFRLRVWYVGAGVVSSFVACRLSLVVVVVNDQALCWPDFLFALFAQLLQPAVRHRVWHSAICG
jgi:hypothetical protein